MKFSLKKVPITRIDSGLIVIPVDAKNINRKGGDLWKDLTKAAGDDLVLLDRASGGIVRKEVKRFEYRAKPHVRRSIWVRAASANTDPCIVRLSGLAPKGSKQRLDSWRRLAGDAFHSAAEAKVGQMAIALSAVDVKDISSIVQAIVEGIKLAAYKFRRYRKTIGQNSKHTDVPVREILLIDASSRIEKQQSAVRIGTINAEAVVVARDLINTPACDLRPRDVVNAARRLTSRSGRLSCRVYGKDALKKIKANLLLAVAAASLNEPFLVHMIYRPRKKKGASKKIVLIGKGITFDSGGLSIKSGSGMEHMKYDMAGAAAVLSVMKGLAELPQSVAVRHEVHAVLPLCENLVSASSTKPGDIVTGMAGKSVEILNTDAEGRLILADALAYSARIKPDIVLDLATLTGACAKALGHVFAGIFCEDEALVAQLRECGERTGERLWPLPLVEEYRKFINSDIADLRNCGTDGPGATTAALFLKEFAPAGARWAHIDIAGPAFPSHANEYTRKGGAGFGVRLLLDYLRQN
jgi:leucyl aminopeptidase